MANDEAVRELHEAQKMALVGQLASGIAHDFNNVLSSITTATTFLLKTHEPSDPSFRDIMQIKQAANRASSLVRHLLAFARKQHLRPQVLDVTEVLDDLGMLLRRLLGERRELKVEHGDHVWPVNIDISQFEQVIVNLVANARDAMEEGGELTIRTRNVAAKGVAKFAYKKLPEADYLLIEVQDTGQGIPLTIVDRIFEPFFSTKGANKGTGLGLSTVLGIVRQSEGFIFLDPSFKGGARFQMFLPRYRNRGGTT